jgi:hypothetical protein
MSTNAPVFCVNHPKTETLLRCNKCGKPVCIKCVVRTPVGYRCKECLNVQHAGYYTATPLDYAIVAAVGTIASIIAGGIAAALGGLFWFFAIFYAPAAGGIIAEIIRWAIKKRAGTCLWLDGGAQLVIGGLIGAGALPILAAISTGHLSLMLAGFLGAFFNLGVWIFVVLGASTVYARLRN